MELIRGLKKEIKPQKSGRIEEERIVKKKIDDCPIVRQEKTIYYKKKQNQ